MGVPKMLTLCVINLWKFVGHFMCLKQRTVNVANQVDMLILLFRIRVSSCSQTARSNRGELRAQPLPQRPAPSQSGSSAQVLRLEFSFSNLWCQNVVNSHRHHGDLSRAHSARTAPPAALLTDFLPAGHARSHNVSHVGYTARKIRLSPSLQLGW